jgi:putative endonuclease
MLSLKPSGRPVKFGKFINSHLFGREQENNAAAYLRKQGLKLVCKNYHSRFGEIDLIMMDKSTLVFVEVRYRRHNTFGGAIGSVSISKQHRIRVTASQFLQSQKKFQHLMCRFDVIGISQRTGDTMQKFHWVKDAFT